MGPSLHHYQIEVSPVPVVLSCVVSFIGAYSAMVTFEQYRICNYMSISPKLYSPRFELVIVSILFGGVAIWAMHFVGMSSCVLRYPESGVESPIYYRIDITAASLVAVIALCFAGMYVSSHDNVFSMDRTDAIAEFYQRSSALSIKAAKKQGKYAFLRETLFRRMMPLCVGGLLTALGVCVMHYTGMVAMHFNGYIVWNKGIVAGSVLIALVVSTIAYWILFRLLVVFPNMEILRIASALIASVAVNGMHYTGMAAASFVYVDTNATVEFANDFVRQDQAMVGAIMAGLSMSFIALALCISDLHGWLFTSGRVMRELDMLATNSLSENKVVDGELFLSTYKSLRAKSSSGKGSGHNKLIIKLRLAHQRSIGHSSEIGGSQLMESVSPNISAECGSDVSRSPTTLFFKRVPGIIPQPEDVSDV